MKDTAYRPAGKRVRALSARALGVAWLATTLACGGSAKEPSTQQSAGFRFDPSLHKVQISAEKAAALEAQGASVLADYGSYKLLQVDDATLKRLPALKDAELRDDYNHILLNSGVIDTMTEHGQSLRGMSKAAVGKRFHIVQFAGPVQPAWFKALEATGVKVVTYIPNNAYLVYGNPAAMNSLAKHTDTTAIIQWDGEYLADFKLHPSVNKIATGAYAIQLVKDEGTNEETLALIRKLQSHEAIVRKSMDYVNVVAFVDRQAIDQLVQRPDVLSIQSRIEPKKFDERQNMILAGQVAGTTPTGPGYLAWLAAKGFTQEQFSTSGFGVDVSDSGLDNATATPNHFALYVNGDVANASRVVYARLEGTPNAGSTNQGCDGHGTLNSHIIGGYVGLTGAPHEDTAGYKYGLGVAPFVKLGSSVVFDPARFTSPDYADLQSRAYRDGMRISSNSWGSSSSAYTIDAQEYDALVRDAQPEGSAVPNPGNQQMIIAFAAGNDGPATNSVGSPSTGKNVITVGASENVHPFGGADACGTADGEANSLLDVASFSGRGPTDDGRKKPDIMAPGTHVSGGMAQTDGQRANPPALPNGQALSCFDASGVCAGFGSDFHPAGQQWTSASSGTSHSTPAVAGGAALLYQYFINQGMAPPSPAMAKAYLMNSTRYMSGTGANDSLYSNNQGTGLMDLGMAFDSVPRMLDDQNPDNLFTATGQTRTFSGAISDSTKPFRVTLAWTDAPGSTTGSAWKNNLDLTVTVGENTYKGNVFTGANSVTGGTADGSNNVESVFLPAGSEGSYTVTVTATNINSDGVPNNGTALDQDFSLVAYNSCNLAPATPESVTAAVAGDNAIDVSWTENGAVSYNIYRSITPGGPYTRVGSATTSPYHDAGVSGGTTYYYVVRGVQCAESPRSTEVSATATGVCTLPPTFAGLTSASNGAASTCASTLSWSAATPVCAGTVSYSVYRSTTQGFAPSAATRIATGVTGTSFSDDLNLTNGSRYYYVVRATEVSSATLEESNTVEKASVPTGIITPAVGFFDDFDANRPANASAYWTPTVLAGNAATTNIVSGCHYQSATNAYRMGATTTTCGGQYLVSQQHVLVLGGNGSTAGINGFAVPATAMGPQMTFNIWYDFETRYDGAWLVYSTTGASGPWTNVSDAVSSTQPYISAGGYDNTLNSSATTRIWTSSNTGANGSLKAVTVNLDALAGRTVWFGFRMHSDTTSNAEGLYVDDVRVSADAAGTCTTNVPPAGPAVGYRVDGLANLVSAGRPATFGLSAVDSAGVVATGYTGSASLSSSDGAATLPATASFTNGVAGGLSVTFGTAGVQSIRATGVENPDLVGGASTNVTTASKLVFTTSPANTVAGVAFAPRVGLVDASGRAVTLGSFNVAVSIQNNAGGGTLSGTTSVAMVNGVANFTGLSINKVGTGYTLKASVAGLEDGISSAFNITPAAAARLVFSTQPSNTVVGSGITPAVQVAIQDALGNQTTSTASVVLALSAGPAATLSGTTTVAAVAGVATFPGLSTTKAGSGFKLSATSGTLTAASSDAFSMIAGASYRAAITRQPTNVDAGAPISPSVQVTLYDEHGNLATHSSAPVSVYLGNNPGNATLGGTTTVNAEAGVASFDNLTVSRPGSNYTLVAGTNGVYLGTSVGFDVREGAASRLVFTSTPADKTAVGSTFTVRVAVQDSAGNLLTSATPEVTLSLATESGATLGGTKTVTAAGGVATFSDVSVDKVGTGYVLQAESAGLSSGASPAFSVVPDYAGTGRLVFRSTPGSATAGANLASIEVELQDSLGNVLTASKALVTLGLGANPAAGSLLGSASVAAVNGVATFDALSLRKAGAGYTLVAAAEGFTGATSAAFAVSPGAVASYSLALPPSITAGQEVTFSATAYDAYGNVATNFSGPVTVTSSDTAAVLPANVLFAEGVSSEVKVTFKSLGLKTLSLGEESLSSVAQTNVTAFAQPTVSITNPAGGTEVSGKVTITAQGAVATGTTLSQLSILVDGVVIGSGTEGTLSAEWDSSGATGGKHSITAVITDGAGNVVYSAPVGINVKASEEPTSCGCAATSGADASLYLGLFALARYVSLRRRQSKRAA
ncbi:S8 family serine peptidase [Archangium violaceum]|uniref:S8 family serine peptidase n=1 Tax=Archangium violaceum TaxID=83451 RepID=UPI0036DF5424